MNGNKNVYSKIEFLHTFIFMDSGKDDINRSK